MSSGEKEKPPATFEERNPFDISRRSHTEVAGEIAKRMAAWKQARGRSYAASATAPSERRPQVSAPVQPTHAPKQSERPAAQPVSAAEAQPRRADTPPQQRPATGSGSGRGRVPYFATFSLQRAMPPAPSPRKADAAPQNPTDLAQSPQAAAIPADSDHDVAPVAKAPRGEGPAVEAVTEIGALPAGVAEEVEAQRLAAEAAAWPPAEILLAHGGPDTIEPGAEAAVPASELAESHSAPAPAAESIAEEAHPDPAHEIDDLRADATAATETESAVPAEADEIEDRRAMARTMRARWIAAHDLDSPHLGESASAEHSAPITPEPEARADDAAAIEAIASNAPAIALAAPPTEMLDEASGRKEPIFDAPMERSDEPAARTSDETLVKKRDFDPPVERQDPVAESVPARQSNEAPRADTPKIASVMPIDALDELSGRKEPTFDAPMTRRDSPDSKGVAPAAARVSDEAPKDELSGRKEPTFDEPAAKPKTAPEPTAKRKPKEAPAAAGLVKGESGIKLRAIETRIEARRIETLRTDPQVSVERPIIPHLERDEWDVPSPISTNRAAERHGWAIGLGAVLLIVGITAPAAIWQHDRQTSPTIQDQVALDPALLPAQQKASGSTPTPAPTTAPAPTTESAIPAAPATVPPPEPAAAQAPATSAPQLTDAQTAPQAETPAETPPVPSAKPEGNQAPQAQQEPPEQTTLSAVQDGGQLDKVPVSAPKRIPKPQAKPLAAPVHLASRASLPFATASGQPSGSEMVAKPFVPGPESDHFLRAPTTGTATVPIDDGSGAYGASVVVKPTLMAQLKPKPAGAKPVKSAAQIYAPKPVPLDQSLDQMFQTLVDTLSEGKPANSATKPLPPSNRK